MKRKKPKLSNLFFALFLLLLLIPQTRKPIQVGINRLKVLVWSPSELEADDQTRLKPFTYALADLKGSPIQVEIGGGKSVFISYWATWCPPCIAELPSIEKLHADYGDQMVFLLLTHEEPEVVARFLEKKNYALPVFIPRMAVPEKLVSPSIPTTYIIDKTGKVIVKETGAADWNSKAVRAILAELVGL